MEKLVLTNNGYLYVEMIVGLMLLSSMMFIFYPSINIDTDSLAFKSDVKKIELIIDHMRLCAMKNGKSELEFTKNNVQTLCAGNRTIHPIKIDISTNFPDNKFSFNQKGNISRAGTISLVKNDNIKKITLHVGYGL